jgi:hypothetical protein
MRAANRGRVSRRFLLLYAKSRWRMGLEISSELNQKSA